jgi:catechol 2,3-dioxygenase-like lactoylglutathione lyase family enzyme
MNFTLHHVALAVPELEPALAFYQDALGLRRLDRPSTLSSTGAWLGLGPVQLHLIEWEGARPQAGTAHGRQSHLALCVADYDAALSHVRNLGLAVTEGTSGLRQFFFYDPAGNTVELIEDQGSLSPKEGRKLPACSCPPY